VRPFPVFSLFRLILPLSMVLCSGCAFLPEIAHQPTVHNPFPQLSKVAIAPFFNQSTEPSVDGRKFAVAYFNQLQSIPGFEVVPVGVVERLMDDHDITLSHPDEARRLCELLAKMEIDVLIIGAVTDFTMYYPPRCGLEVHWYATNPCFHPIPPGYGLPWGTPAEENIPAPLVFEAEFALAKAQLKTQTPIPPESGSESASKTGEKGEVRFASSETDSRGGGEAGTGPEAPPEVIPPGRVVEGSVVRCPDEAAPGFPPDWPDPRGFIPPPPSSSRPPCWPNHYRPVMQQSTMYIGNSSEFTEALASYYFFRDDARFGGWQSYLERSDDFIAFCCHAHIYEMLSARGGAGETRVVWRWKKIR